MYRERRLCNPHFFTGDDEADKVKELAKTARQLKSHNAELGITHE